MALQVPAGTAVEPGRLLDLAESGDFPRERAYELSGAQGSQLVELMLAASRLRDRYKGRLVTYSRKVFIPLTRLCRNVCHYCTFATSPRAAGEAYLSPDEVLAIARAGQAAGCTEALFTLGDKPELRHAVAHDALRALGASTTVEYLARMCALVLEHTSLLPHVNGGVMTGQEIAALRRVSVAHGGDQQRWSHAAHA